MLLGSDMGIDYSIFKFINSFVGKSAVLDYLGIFFAKYLIWVFVVLIIVLVIFYKNKKEKHLIKKSLICILGAIILSLAINYFISLCCFRPRPFVNHMVYQLVNKSALEKSFPSNHATIAFAVAFAVYFWYKRIGTVLIIFALFIGLARVFVGVHYPLDIIAGGIIGFLSALVTNKIVNKNYRIKKSLWRN